MWGNVKQESVKAYNLPGFKKNNGSITTKDYMLLVKRASEDVDNFSYPVKQKSVTPIKRQPTDYTNYEITDEKMIPIIKNQKERAEKRALGLITPKVSANDRL